jgi:outer membrane PBP1 activator LpoA protein
MKTIYVALFAFAALTFTACGGNAENSATDAQESADEMTDELMEEMDESGDYMEEEMDTTNAKVDTLMEEM